jgi:hypothetical protein
MLHSETQEPDPDNFSMEDAGSETVPTIKYSSTALLKRVPVPTLPTAPISFDVVY